MISSRDSASHANYGHKPVCVNNTGRGKRPEAPPKKNKKRTRIEGFSPKSGGHKKRSLTLCLDFNGLLMRRLTRAVENRLKSPESAFARRALNRSSLLRATSRHRRLSYTPSRYPHNRRDRPAHCRCTAESWCRCKRKSLRHIPLRGTHSRFQTCHRLR